MTFLLVDIHRLINHRHIREAHLTEGPFPDTIVTLNDGSQLQMRGNCLSDLLNPIGIVPASPGYFTLEYYQHQDDPFFVDRHPVIAWRIVGDNVNAIAPDWDVNGKNVAILYPDGRVVKPGDQEWESYDQWLAYKKALDPELDPT